MSSTDHTNHAPRIDDWYEETAPFEERVRDVLLRRSRGGITTMRTADLARILGVRPKQARAGLSKLWERGSVVTVRRPGGADLHYLTAATVVCPACQS